MLLASPLLVTSKRQILFDWYFFLSEINNRIRLFSHRMFISFGIIETLSISVPILFNFHYLYNYPLICPSVHPSIHQSVFLSIYLYVCLSFFSLSLSLQLLALSLTFSCIFDFFMIILFCFLCYFL